MNSRPVTLAAPLLVLIIPLLNTPLYDDPAWASRMPVVLLLGTLAFPLLWMASRRPLEPAVLLAIGFLGWASISTAFSKNPGHALLGVYGWGTGLLFVSALVGAWLIGSCVDQRQRAMTERALLAAVGINAFLAIAQVTTVLDKSPLGRHDGRAYGLMGNPVYLAGLLVGGLWLLYHQTNRTARVVPIVVLFAVAVELTGARSGVLAAGLGLAVSATKNWRRASVLLVATVLGLGIGMVLTVSEHSTSGTARLAEGGAGGGFRARTEAWMSASHAIADRPIVGAGPGRFGAAATPYRTLAFARSEGPGRFYLDAHNILVEYTVTTGIVGALLFAAWIVTSFRRAGPRSPLAAAALGMLILHLVEPQSVTTTPLLFLLLGAASPPLLRPAGRAVRAFLVTIGSAGLAGAAALGFGLFALNQASLDYERSWAQTADRMLPIWGEPKAVLGRIAALRALETRQHRYTVESLRYRRDASRADPSDEIALEALASFELQLGQRAEGTKDVARILELNPWSPNALNILGRIFVENGDRDHALFFLRRSLLVAPDQPGTKRLVDRL